MQSRDEWLEKLALIDRQLQAPDEPTSNLVEELIDMARALRLPADEHREDAHRFVEGLERVESATWKQCGGLIYALEHKQVADERALASRVAQRIFDLLPTHY